MLEKPKGKRVARFKGAEQEGTMKTVNIKPLNDNQALYLKHLKASEQVIVCGFSGTGKTFMAATYAANMYANREIVKIILTRPNVAVGKDLGYFPGTLEEKFAPWAAPVLDVLNEQLGKGTVETGIKNRNIEMAPLALMRGRSFKDAFIIVDEAQNISVAEIKMLLTRVGENSMIVINGDIQQSDLKEADGLSKIIHLAKKHMLPVPIVEFQIEDIVRSDICAMWVKVFYKEKL
jgi:phosphate starvation-inducible PhoH-like protein